MPNKEGYTAQPIELESHSRVKTSVITPRGRSWIYRSEAIAFIGLLALLTACSRPHEPEEKSKPVASATATAITIKPTETASSVATRSIVAIPSAEPSKTSTPRPQPTATARPTLRSIDATAAPTVPAEIKDLKEYQNRLPQLSQVIDMLKMAVRPTYQGPVAQTSNQSVKEHLLYQLFEQDGKKDLPVDLPKHDTNKAPFLTDVESPLQDIFNSDRWDRDGVPLQKTAYRATYLSNGQLSAFNLNGKIDLSKIKEAQSYLRSEVGRGYSISANRLKDLEQVIFNPLPNITWEKMDEFGVLRIISISSQGRIDINIQLDGEFSYSYLSPADPRFASEQEAPATPPGRAMVEGLVNIYDLIKPENRTFSSLREYTDKMKRTVTSAERADQITRNPYRAGELEYELRTYAPKDVLKAASSKQFFPFPSVTSIIKYSHRYGDTKLRAAHEGTTVSLMVDPTLFEGAKPYLDSNGRFIEGGMTPVLKKGFDIQGIIREYGDDEKGRLWGRTKSRINEVTLFYDGSKFFLRWAIPTAAFSF